MSRIASDIGTGITELPRAALKGARDAAQETVNFAVEAGNWVGEKQDALVGLFGGAPGKDIAAPQLPSVDAPQSTTGKLATSVSQLITGMVGLGKVAGPLKAVSGGRAAKVAVESAKAATVGAVAFDPSAERFSNLVESAPILSNPVTQLLAAQPGDTRGLGRMKNALESIGMDAALVGVLVAGTKAFRAVQDWRAGKITAEEMQKAVGQAEKADIARAKIEEPPPSSAPAADPVAPAVDPNAPAPVPRDVMDLGAGPAAPNAVSAPVPRDVLDLTAPPPGSVTERIGPLPADAPPPVKFTDIADEQVAALVASTKADADAFTSAGSWDAAVSEGHVFGRGERIPWQKLMAQTDQVAGESTELPLSIFMRRVADTIEKDINKARGGNADGVLTDRMADAAWRRRVEAWGDNPQEVIGLLSQAGKSARSAVANYEAGLLLGQRAVQDTFAAAQRIRMGDLTAWGGSQEMADAGLRDMLRVVATINGNTEALKASFGRGLRRTRAEFSIKPEDMANLLKLDGEQLAKTLAETGGDPRVLKKLATPSMWERLQDGSQWLLVNNLLWGWKTHTVNLLTNAYMGMARPMERIIGSYAVGGSEAATMRLQAWKQYSYMGQSLIDGFQSAGRAWREGDSILAPHSVEANAQNLNVAAMQFRSPDNVSAILHNVGVGAMKTLGLPTRALGVVDELNKQVVYRSKVMAEAHVSGMAQGLSGDDLTRHVQKAVLEAFDDAGHGVNLQAIQEAKTATFSQDLLPGTMGSGVQHFVQNVPLVRIILPFVKTPTNVLRYGLKVTPGLNMLQTEYRQMLSGAMGAEAKAQAVGQMSLGTLFLGSAAWLATSGFITGGGPSDPEQKQMLLATGWQPYSFVSVGPNGQKRYVSFGKYDPVAMPFGIVADLVDAMSNSEEDAGVVENVGTVGVAALMSIVKQLGQKTYLTSLNSTMDAIMDPDRSMGKVAAQTAANFVPASSLLRNTTQLFFDEHMRDARSLADKVMAMTPGLSDKVPPKRDVWGDPMLVSKGLWVTNEKDAVDAEVRRMIAEEGAAFGPSPYLVGGVDLRDIVMTNGRNAYDQYQDWVGHPSKSAMPLKDNVARLIKSPAYTKAPDGDAGTRGTKQWMITGVISKYRASAAQRLRADSVVREAMFEKQRDVAKAYSASKAPQAPQRGQLEAVGKAFGVDLGGLGSP